MKIWTISNQKGGVGKTTTTVTLAGLLSGKNENTLMVDLDPHGSLSSYFGIDPETVDNSVYDLFHHAANKKPVDAGMLVKETEFSRLSLIPASTALAALERQLGSQHGMGLVLLHALNRLKEHYNYVLIDCPPMLGMLMVSAIAACDQLIIPVQTEYLAIKGLQRMLRTLAMISRTLKSQLPYLILPTMYDERTLASKQSLQQMRSSYSDKIGQLLIPVDTKFRDASNEGKPVSYIHPNTHGVMAYAELLSVLLDETGNTDRVVVA